MTSRRLASTTAASRWFPKLRRALNQIMTTRYQGIAWRYLRLNSESIVGHHLRKFEAPTRDRDGSPMTKITALTAIATIVVAIAAPVSAQDTIGPGYGLKSQPGTKHRSNYRGPHNQSFRGSYNRSSASFYTRPLTTRERLNKENFGWSGRDPSRVGGEDPSLHPAS